MKAQELQEKVNSRWPRLATEAQEEINTLLMEYPTASPGRQEQIVAKILALIAIDDETEEQRLVRERDRAFQVAFGNVPEAEAWPAETPPTPVPTTTPPAAIVEPEQPRVGLTVQDIMAAGHREEETPAATLPGAEDTGDLLDQITVRDAEPVPPVEREPEEEDDEEGDDREVAPAFLPELEPTATEATELPAPAEERDRRPIVIRPPQIPQMVQFEGWRRPRWLKWPRWGCRAILILALAGVILGCVFGCVLPFIFGGSPEVERRAEDVQRMGEDITKGTPPAQVQFPDWLSLPFSSRGKHSLEAWEAAIKDWLFRGKEIPQDWVEIRKTFAQACKDKKFGWTCQPARGDLAPATLVAGGVQEAALGDFEQVWTGSAEGGKQGFFRAKDGAEATEGMVIFVAPSEQGAEGVPANPTAQEPGTTPAAPATKPTATATVQAETTAPSGQSWLQNIVAKYDCSRRLTKSETDQLGEDLKAGRGQPGVEPADAETVLGPQDWVFGYWPNDPPAGLKAECLEEYGQVGLFVWEGPGELALTGMQYTGTVIRATSQ